VLLAYATSGLTAAIIIAVGVTLINQLGDNVILPLMAKRSLDMSLSVQFVSFLVWTWVLGPAGALLALPLTMVVRLVLSMSPRTRWMGDWLSGHATAPISDEPAGVAMDERVSIVSGER
jgi:predicted PurR-regulated permease PerM